LGNVETGERNRVARGIGDGGSRGGGLVAMETTTLYFLYICENISECDVHANARGRAKFSK
jgi:hypothetical protein